MLLTALKNNEYILNRDYPETFSLMNGLVVVYLKIKQIIKVVYFKQRAFFLNVVKYGLKHLDILGII